MQPKLKENTWNTKETIIRNKMLPYFKNKKMKDIKPADIIQWQNVMIGIKNKDGTQLKPTCLKTIQAELSALFNHAVQFYDKKSSVVKSEFFWENQGRGNAFLDERGISAIHSAGKGQAGVLLCISDTLLVWITIGGVLESYLQ